MFFGGFLRNDDGEHQVDGPIVGRFEIDWLLESEKTTDGFLQVRQACMRHSKTLAQPGTAETLSIQQVVVDGGFRKLGLIGSDVCDQFQQLLFTGDIGIDEDFLGRQKR